MRVKLISLIMAAGLIWAVPVGAGISARDGAMVTSTVKFDATPVAVATVDGQSPRRRSRVSLDGKFRGIGAHRISDLGGGADDSGELFSGQMLDFDGVDDVITIGDIYTDLSAVAFTIDADVISDGGNLVTLGAGLTIDFGVDVITTTGLTGVTIYIDGVAATAVDTNIHRVFILFDAVIADAVTLGAGLDGKLGNVQAWSAQPVPDDIVWDYNHPEAWAYDRPGTELRWYNLKAAWRLIEGAGATAYNWVDNGIGSGRHGRLDNFTLPDAWDNAAGLTSLVVSQTAYCSWGLGSNLLLNSSLFAPDSTVWTDTVSGSGALTENTPGWGFKAQITDAAVGRAYKTQIINLAANTDYILSVKVFNIPDVASTQGNLSVSGFAGAVTATSDTDTITTGTGVISINISDGGWHEIAFSSDAVETGLEIRMGIGVLTDEPAAVNSISISHVQLEAALDRGPIIITQAAAAAEIAAPVRSSASSDRWFDRDYQSLNFNGRSYVSCGVGADVSPSDAFIIDAVVRSQSRNQAQYFFNKEGAFYLRQSAAGKLEVGITQTSGATEITTDFQVDDGKNHYIGCYFNGTTLAVWMDAANDTSLPAAYPDEPLAAVTEPLRVGAQNPTTGFLSGQIFHFNLYPDDQATGIFTAGIFPWKATQYRNAKKRYLRRYYYSATAQDDEGLISLQCPPAVVTVENVPFAERDVEMTWTANPPEDNVVGYWIYRKPQAPGQFMRINSELITETTYTDTIEE